MTQVDTTGVHSVVGAAAAAGDRAPVDHGGRPLAHVDDLNTNEEVQFHASWDDTLARVWDRAYSELGEARRPNDVLECDGGQPLAQYLGLTLAQLRDQHICPNRKFAIRGETGGASPHLVGGEW